MTERFKIYTAVFLFLRRENEIFMMRRFNTGFRDGYYDVISGHLEGDETYRETAVREAKEEAGVDVTVGDLQFIHVIHSKTNKEYVSLYFATDVWSGEPRLMEKDKCDDVGWYSVENLPKMIAPHVKQALENSMNGVFYSEYGW